MDKYELQLATILDDNIELAKAEKRPLCQDCGVAQVFIKKGKFFSYSHASSLSYLIERGVEEAYENGKLRKSTVSDPFERKNPGTNLPVFIHMEEVDGADLTIQGIVKGGGSENVSTLKMLAPSEGRQGVADFVIETLKQARGKGCPPYFVGIAVGGTFDTVTSLSKQALITKDVDDTQLYDMINDQLSELDFGILGFPGKLAVKELFIKTSPTHIAMMPVAVSLNCHSYRCGEIKL